MSLKTIINELSSEFGFSISNSVERETLVSGINKVARRLYVEDDIDGSLVENVFDFDQSSNQISLTPDADVLRGIRYFESRVRVNTRDMYPRYHHGGFSREAWPLQFRVINKTPLARDISNQSTLTFTIPAVDSNPVVITAIGSSTTSSQIKEIITIPAGALEAESIANFDSLWQLTKETKSLYDIDIYDAAGTLMASWPNFMTQLEHIVFQIYDEEVTPVLEEPAVEVLYKQHFIPYVEDTDVFQCGERYEEAIFWKYVELYNLRKKKDKAAAEDAGGEVKKIMDAHDVNGSEYQTKKMNFKRPGVLAAMDTMRYWPLGRNF